MRAAVSREAAQAQVTAKYRKLHKSLIELVSALNLLEPGGTLLDDVTVTTKEDGRVRIAYVTTPMQVAITTPERKFILKVIEHAGSLP